MLKVIQYLKGYVVIRVWGFSPERFMNLCSNHHIFLWDIQNNTQKFQTGYYEMSMSVRDFYRLKAIVKKTGTRVSIQKKCGLPFFMHRARKRKIFIIGLLGSLFFWIWMSGYIWAIEIQGNYYVSHDIMMEFLQEQEIRVGMKRSLVNIESLEKEIRRQYDVVTWTSARIDGTRLVIQLKENDVRESNPREEPEDGEGYDLVAENDGIVKSIVTRSGIPLVTEGTYVVKGDILVEGKIPIYQDDNTVKEYQYCRADADIYIQSIYQLTRKLGETYEAKQYTENQKTLYTLMVFGKTIKFPFYYVNKYELYDIYEEKKQLKLLENFYLPVYYGKETIREYEIVTNVYTKDEVKEQFSQELLKFIETLSEKGVQIIGKNVTINKENKAWKMKVDLGVVEKTGRNVLTEKPAVTENEDAAETEELAGVGE